MHALLACTCIFAVLLGQATAELTQEQKDLMTSLRNGCLAETGADEGMVNGCMKGNFPEDAKLKCYMKCTFSQMAVMDDDGVLDADTMIAMLPDELQEAATPAIEACKDVRGSDPCDNAFQFNKCLYSKNPDKFMII